MHFFLYYGLHRVDYFNASWKTISQEIKNIQKTEEYAGHLYPAKTLFSFFAQKQFFSHTAASQMYQVLTFQVEG